MKILTCSRHFPKGHARAAKPTYFVEKILLGLVEDKLMMKSKCVEMARQTGINEDHPMYYIDSIHGYDDSCLKRTTIRAGSRWKAGDMASLRIWSGVPRRSKQIEFAQVEVKKVWDIEINNRFGAASFEVVINGIIYGQLHYGNDKDVNESGLIMLAKNDGLELDDFTSWFEMHPNKTGLRFTGQIICWSDKIEYP